jgi:hypothetical protein
MAGKKLIVGPSLTMHGGWQLVPLSAVYNYGPSKIWLVASTAADVTLSTDATNSFTLKSGYTLEIPLEGGAYTQHKGTELLSNGNCSATGSWTAGAHWRFGKTGHTGKANRTGTTGAQALSQAVTPESGEIYELSYVATHSVTGATGALTPTFGGTSFTKKTPTTTGTVTYTDCVKTTNATGPLRFTPMGGTQVDLDTISLKKVTGHQLLFAKGTAGVILQVMFTI